ncbi:MAG: hypothetical protein OXS47_12235 [Chloroflexota bacterium]|nr:hypothetical protein [Chloroflexota bacterium]
MAQPTPELEQRFSDWQRGLTLTDKKSQSAAEVAARQADLIDAVKAGSASFAGYLGEALELDPGSLGAPPLPRKIDPSEFRDPPLQLESDLFDMWSSELHARAAAQPLLWTRWHLQWIREGQFGERLDEAFLGTLANGSEEKTTEAATRNLLRRLGGLPHVRGKVSVLNDCPLSRAWWRGRVALDAATQCEGAFDAPTAHRVLHSSNDAWARLVGDSVRRITVVNHSGLRAALIHQYRTASRDSAPVPAQELQTAVRLLARNGPALVFGALSWEELLDQAATALALARDMSNGTPPEAEEVAVAAAAEPSADPALKRWIRRLTT